jgi:glycerol-3-phosphate cytidylyltransferase-like family protein
MSSPTDQRLHMRAQATRSLSTVKEVVDETPEDTESETSNITVACCACGRKKSMGKKMRMKPCDVSYMGLIVAIES